MEFKNYFLQEHSRTIADTFTYFRLGVAIYLFLEALYLPMQNDLNYLIIVLIIAWFTDLFDGTIARINPAAKPSWIGRNDGLVDSILTFSVQVYLSSVVHLHSWVDYTLYIIFVLSLLQVLLTDAKNVFLEMLYSALVYGMLLVFAILTNSIGWVALLVYFSLAILYNKKHFFDHVLHFLTLGRHEHRK